MRARTRWLTVTILTAVLGAGCAGPSRPVSSSDLGAKAGGKPGPIAITVADSQPSGKPSNVPLTEFKRQVESLSGGTMTVTILTEAVADADPPGSDGALIERLKSGAFQMAVVPARAWSAAGVTSLKALQAPFLFDSDEHVAALVNDAAITKDLLSGLDGSGVTGLTLFPESLRHLFSFGPPMLTPADVKGKTIRAIASVETTAIIAALGGTAVDPVGDGYPQGVSAGTIQGTESGFSLSSGGPNRTATATGNVALYAKVMTLAINSDLWTRLDDAQRAIITTASDATRAWAIANQVKDAEAAATFCADGGTVVLADAAGIAAFRAAEAPVYAALEADPATKRTIEAIKVKAPSTSEAAAVKACQPVIDATTLVPDGGDLPNGIYRIEATEAYLRAGYPDYVGSSEGIYTFAFRDGRWSFDYVAPGGGGDHQKGVYRVDGNEVSWLWDPCCSHPNPVLHLKWTVDADGTLRFNLLSGPADWALALPFKRIGDLP